MTELFPWKVVKLDSPSSALVIEATNIGKVFYCHAREPQVYEIDPRMPLIDIKKELEQALMIFAYIKGDMEEADIQGIVNRG